MFYIRLCNLIRSSQRTQLRNKIEVILSIPHDDKRQIWQRKIAKSHFIPYKLLNIGCKSELFDLNFRKIQEKVTTSPDMRNHTDLRWSSGT